MKGLLSDAQQKAKGQAKGQVLATALNKVPANLSGKTGLAVMDISDPAQT